MDLEKRPLVCMLFMASNKFQMIHYSTRLWAMVSQLALPTAEIPWGGCNLWSVQNMVVPFPPYLGSILVLTDSSNPLSLRNTCHPGPGLDYSCQSNHPKATYSLIKVASLAPSSELFHRGIPELLDPSLHADCILSHVYSLRHTKSLSLSSATTNHYQRKKPSGCLITGFLIKIKRHYHMI